MKKLISFLVLVLLGSANMALADSANGKPELIFNKNGKLVQVKTSDGRSCIFNYAPNGSFLSSIPAACGNPQAWIKAGQ